MRVHSNAQIAFTANRTQKNELSIEKSLGKLTTGKEMPKGSDNASGVTISEKMRAQIRGLARAQHNMNDGLSALETMNEGMNNISGLTDRARELAILAATDTLTDEDRAIAQGELTNILDSIDETARNLEFNTRAILGEAIPLVIQIGSNANQKIEINLIEVTAEKLGLIKTGPNAPKRDELIATREHAEASIQNIDDATAAISKHMTEIGSKMQAIESHMANAAMYESNLTRALSQLEDVSVSKEMMHFVQSDIRQQGDQLLIRQVNTNLKEILQLFQP